MSETSLPDHGPGMPVPAHLALFRTWNPLCYYIPRFSGGQHQGRLARPWTGTPNPWKRRSNPEKIRTRVGTGDGCPHPRRLRSRRSSIIRIQSPQALSIGCLTASKMHWRRRHEERHGRTADAVLWIIGRGSAPTIKSYHAGGDPHLPSQILGFQTRPEHFRPLCNECLKHQ